MGKLRVYEVEFVSTQKHKIEIEAYSKSHAKDLAAAKMKEFGAGDDGKIISARLQPQEGPRARTWEQVLEKLAAVPMESQAQINERNKWWDNYITERRKREQGKPPNCS